MSTRLYLAPNVMAIAAMLAACGQSQSPAPTTQAASAAADTASAAAQTASAAASSADAAASSAAAAAPAAKAANGEMAMKPAAAYDPASLPDDAYGKMVKYGKELTERTYAHIGPEVKDVKMRYAGNNLSCTSCHQASATKPFAMSWVGSHSTFPQYRGREDTISTIEERVNGCMERSMNGKSLPFDSKEMKAFTTYIHFLSKDVPVGTKVTGQGLMKYTPPNRKVDLVAGEAIYKQTCAVCHGPDGQGVRGAPAKPGEPAGYTFPPLWGKDTFNNGAGMNRMLTASAFIMANMPQGTSHEKPQLTEEQAFDVAGYVLSKPRPIKSNLDKDFPARWNKPVDAAFPPYVTGATAEDHRFGPFQPLQDKMKELKDELKKKSDEAKAQKVAAK